MVLKLILICALAWISHGMESPCTGFRVRRRSSGLCEFCPTGFTGDSSRGSTRCVPCPRGTAMRPGTYRCRPCGEGQNSFVTGAQYCIPDNAPCAPNFFRNSNGACLKCTRLQRFDPRGRRCVNCSRGMVSTEGISRRCGPCPRGMIATSFSQRGPSCICRPGFGFVPGSRGTRCMRCPLGTEGNGEGFCAPCPSGFGARCRCFSGRQMVNGACVACPRGTFGFLSIDGCQLCPPGTFSSRVGGVGRFTCRNCRPGMFTDEPGQSSCKTCPEGTTSFGIGETGCVRSLTVRES